MDTTQWPQGIGVVEGGGAIRRARPEKDEEVKCPRCNSTNTKFCYYNNYSLSQPRYFCKTCRRYWTEGGSLRNVPVGGGSRKNKRPSSSSSSPSPTTSSKNIKLDHHHHHHINVPSKTQLYQGQDLNLAFPPTSADQDHHLIPKFVIQYDQNPNTTTTTTTTCADTTPSIMSSASANNSRGLMSSFMSMMPGSGSDSMYPNGLQELKPSGALNFSLDGFGHHEITNNNNGARLLFPFEDPNTRGGNGGDHSTAAGYWTGMLGGEGSW